jgi:cell division septation protein DedD
VDTRKELNAMNYKDAFVVAYCYGKKMSVNEARAMLAAGKDCRTGTPSEIAANNSVKNESANAGGVSNANIVNGNMNAPSTVKLGETLPQQDIQVIKGLLYTVQVGVYSKPVKAGQLYNITPLYYELNKKGLYRYTSGIFDNIREASAAKDVIVKIGVTDAFVSAYINGKRIPMEEAATIVSQQGKAAFANMQGMNMQPKVIPMSNEKAKNENNTEVTPSSNKVAPAGNTPANIVYKVQLGAFRNQVPVEVMNKYLSIAEKGISNQKNGYLTIYTVGNFKSLQEAESVKADVVAKGITDAFIAVFNNGSKITIEEAKRLEGKQ